VDTPSHPSPADLARVKSQQAAVTPQGPILERSDTIHTFAWFPYRGERRDDLGGSALFRRAWSNALEGLAELAEDEDWTGVEAGDRELPILDSYVRYTYKRLSQERKVGFSDGRDFAAMNTGLLTEHAEDIFGLFERNNRPGGQEWKFRKWATESDREMLRHFPAPPEMAVYVASASNLVYDVDRELKLAYDHILGDNIDRFPPELAAQPKKARQALDYAVALTLKRTRRNYKIVVPQWYPRFRESGFLLPLDLTGSGTADLALVVSAVGDTAYRGNTVLTLEMAYTVARLVSRPDSEWLKPMALPSEAADEE